MEERLECCGTECHILLLQPGTDAVRITLCVLLKAHISIVLLCVQYIS
jgi:hypothetical protein